MPANSSIPPGPQYSPVGGYGTQDSGYVFTQSGWQPIQTETSTGTKTTTPTGTGMPSGGTGTTGTTPGGTTQPGGTQAPGKSAADIAYEKYLASLTGGRTPTAQTAYNEFIANRDRSLQTIGDKTIPMTFITGQQASVADRAQIEANRLQGDVGIAQEEDRARMEQAKLGYEYEADREKAQADQFAKQTQPFELSPGQGRYNYNPETGRYEQSAYLPPLPRETSSTLASKPIALTNTDRQALLGVLDQRSITELERQINEFGLKEVLAVQTDQDVVKAIQKAYGVDQKDMVTRDQLEGTITSGVAYDGLKKAYTDAELYQMAKELGYTRFLTGKTKDIERLLNSPDAKKLYIDLLYNQYKAAGMAE
jgi:hypothetical protein